MKVFRIQIGVILLALLVGGCSTPPAVKDLSKQAIQNSKFLAGKHDDSLAAFKKFTEDSEVQANTLAGYAQRQNQKLQAMAILALKREVEAREAILLVDFDDEASSLLAEQFEATLESKFIAPIQTQFNKLLAEEQQLKTESDSHPDDALGRANYNKKSIEARAFYALALEKELELRKKMNQQLLDARRSIQATIQNAFKAIHAQLDAQTNPDSVGTILASAAAEPDQKKLVSYDGVRIQIVAYGTLMQSLYTAQQQSLESLDNYINRPTEISLLLQGVFQGIKTELSAELPKLGDFGKTLAGPLGQFLDNTEQSLQKTTDGLSATIDQKINGVLAEFTKSVTDKAAETISPPAKTPGK